MRRRKRNAKKQERKERCEAEERKERREAEREARQHELQMKCLELGVPLSAVPVPATGGRPKLPPFAWILRPS